MPQFAHVALPLPDIEPFTYSVPPELVGSLIIGSRVIVPLRNSLKTGVITGFAEECNFETIKDVVDIADTDPPLPVPTMELCSWISEYYQCSLGETLAAAHPAGMLMESQKVVTFNESFKGESTGFGRHSDLVAELVGRLNNSKSVPLTKLRKEFRRKGLLPALSEMEKCGMILIENKIWGKKLKPQRVSYLAINSELSEDFITTWLEANRKKSPKQTAVILLLQGSEAILKKLLMTETGASSTTINSLINKNLVRETHKEVIRSTHIDFEENFRIKHTDNQKLVIGEIIAAIESNAFVPFLLHGVTGSGKTEVYMEAISHCLQKGKTAMVLVPEIALTPQIASRFRHRFGSQVVIMHSRISSGERYDSWRRLAQGKAKVVIGARSALFAPMQKLGLIIVDEEHEQSFKQFNRPHYHARDCAVWLAKHLAIPIVLGSATPAMETFYNARQGKYRFLELPERVAGGKFSTFHLVDLTEENALIGNSSISPLLMEKIEDRLEHGDKTIILQNRRGFSPFIKCKLCGKVEECPDCSVTLTYHITNRRLRCHLCGYQKRPPEVCGECGGIDLKYCGTGTQKVEDHLEMFFPDARIVRMDLDTTTAIDSHSKILEAFARGKYDILLGTQMVAKGLDFPEVTLVGVISADTELLRPDFRAEERTFRLLVQAAGRSGRHRPGEVVVQTHNPQHSIFNFVRNNDYLGFYEKTIRDRKSLRYPPYGRLIKINISGAEEGLVIEASNHISKNLPRNDSLILGPSPALISKIKRKYYYHILLKTGLYSIQKLQRIKAEIFQVRTEALNTYRKKKITIELDVDPVEMH